MYIQKIKYKCIMLISCVSLLMACSTDASKETVEKDAPVKEEGLELTLAQMETVGIELGTVEQKNLDSVVKVNGQLAVPPQNRADVSILSGGIIGHIRVLEGQQVRKGQVLATINNQDMIKIQQDYLVAKSNFSYVEAEYERQKQLKAAGAGIGKSFQSAEASYHAERSRIGAYESQLKQLGVAVAGLTTQRIISEFPVLSPINGTVGHITANTGAFVQPGTSIMEVVDNSKIHCDLTVFEKDLRQVKVGQKVHFQLTNQENLMITGRINGINKSFEDESKGVVVHAVIDQAKGKNLIPGMYVTALISTGSKLTSAVPLGAVVNSEGKSYIFVVEEGQKGDVFRFKKTEVKTGIAENGYLQITLLKELPVGAKIVNKGAFYLESKAAGGEEEE